MRELPLPPDLRAMLETVRRIGRPRLVGGGVRDWLLGLPPKDFDIEVAGADFETLQRALAPFGATDIVGRSFGVIKVRSTASGAEYDFSLPRRESKTGAGHRGFAVAPDPGLSDAAAAARRDFSKPLIQARPFYGLWFLSFCVLSFACWLTEGGIFQILHVCTNQPHQRFFEGAAECFWRSPYGKSGGDIWG